MSEWTVGSAVRKQYTPAGELFFWLMIEWHQGNEHVCEIFASLAGKHERPEYKRKEAMKGMFRFLGRG